MEAAFAVEAAFGSLPQLWASISIRVVVKLIGATSPASSSFGFEELAPVFQ